MNFSSDLSLWQCRMCHFYTKTVKLALTDILAKSSSLGLVV